MLKALLARAAASPSSALLGAKAAVHLWLCHCLRDSLLSYRCCFASLKDWDDWAVAHFTRVSLVALALLVLMGIVLSEVDTSRGMDLYLILSYVPCYNNCAGWSLVGCELLLGA